MKCHMALFPIFRFISGILALYFGNSVAEDCSALLGSSGKKRLIFDSFNNLPDQVKAILPGHPEVDSRCRFDLTRLSQSQTQTLKSLHNQGYSICVGCSQTSSDHGRCHSIEVCQKGTSCIQGHNDNLIPTYYWHGCCEDTDPKCVSGRFDLSIPYKGHHYPLHYRKIVCNGPLCNENGYTSQKNTLISQLATSSQTVPATAQATPSTTPKQAGPVNGGFTTWGTWGACDKSCDIGVRIRTRSCTNPVPSNGGANCIGQSTMTELCNVNPCSK